MVKQKGRQTFVMGQQNSCWTKTASASTIALFAAVVITCFCMREEAWLELDLVVTELLSKDTHPVVYGCLWSPPWRTACWACCAGWGAIYCNACWACWACCACWVCLDSWSSMCLACSNSSSVCSVESCCCWTAAEVESASRLAFCLCFLAFLVAAWACDLCSSSISCCPILKAACSVCACCTTCSVVWHVDARLCNMWVFPPITIAHAAYLKQCWVVQ